MVLVVAQSSCGFPVCTAIVVHDDQFEVIGDGHVGIFEAKSRSGTTFVTLSRGQKFDLRRRMTVN